tara:strand:+ start:3930 stop:4565 length:636 start_codon:yes stop_codon:yes gene_type:complete
MSSKKKLPKKIILIGGGGHCISCIEVLKNVSDFDVLGIVDEYINTFSDQDIDILGKDSDLQDLRKQCDYALICIGQIKDPSPRKKMFTKLRELNFQLPSIFSSKAYISTNIKIGLGSIIMNGCFVNSDVKIGHNCILNNKCHIEHGVNIGDNCHISTSAVINGDVTIGDDVFLGSNSTIANGVTIGDNCIIGAGLFIGHNVEANTTLKYGS